MKTRTLGTALVSLASILSTSLNAQHVDHDFTKEPGLIEGRPPKDSSFAEHLGQKDPRGSATNQHPPPAPPAPPPPAPPPPGMQGPHGAPPQPPPLDVIQDIFTGRSPQMAQRIVEN